MAKEAEYHSGAHEYALPLRTLDAEIYSEISRDKVLRPFYRAVQAIQYSYSTDREDREKRTDLSQEALRQQLIPSLVPELLQEAIQSAADVSEPINTISQLLTDDKPLHGVEAIAHVATATPFLELEYNMLDHITYRKDLITGAETIRITHEKNNTIEATFEAGKTTIATYLPRNPDYLSNIEISRMPHRIVYTIEDGRVVSEIHHETDDKNSPVRATYTFDADGTRHGDRPGKEVELPGGRRGYFDSSDYNSTITAKK